MAAKLIPLVFYCVTATNSGPLPSYETPQIIHGGVIPPLLLPVPSTYQDLSSEQCKVTLEVLQLQDVTQSYTDHVPTLKAELPGIVSMINSNYPESRYALATYRDKPIPPLGYNSSSWHDDCLKSWGVFGDDTATFLNNINALYTAGGLDWKESMLDSLLRAVLTDALNWSPLSVVRDPQTGLPLIRTVVILTDTLWHVEGDAKAATANGPHQVVSNHLLQTPAIIAADPNAMCGDQDYPSIQDLREALIERRVLPIFLVEPSYWVDSETGESHLYPDFVRKAAETGNEDYLDPLKGMMLFHRDLLFELGITGIVAPLRYASSTLHDEIQAALLKIPDLICEPVVTTTAPTPIPTPCGEEYELDVNVTLRKVPKSE